MRNKVQTRFVTAQRETRSKPSILHPLIIAGLLVLAFIASTSSVQAVSLSGQLGLSHAPLQQNLGDKLIMVGQRKLNAAEEFKLGYEAYRHNHGYLAKRIWEPLAKQGYLEAQYYMGVLHDAEIGQFPDGPRAVRWYQQVAKQGHIEAQHNLAIVYAKGKGVKQNFNKAVYWWQKAALQGNADSQYNLGIIYAVGNVAIKRDVFKAKKWWLMAATKGDAMAQYNLGALYASGDKGVRNYCEAARWWQRSVQNGFAKANVALEGLANHIDYESCN